MIEFETRYVTRSTFEWAVTTIDDPRGRALADRHYSRRKGQAGKRGFVPPGRRIALYGQDARGGAVWATCLNRDPVGTWRWRCTIYRNESSRRTSEIGAEATLATYQAWLERYKSLPSVPLTTEIGVLATAARRSKRSPVGICFLEAGWRFLRIVDGRAHARPVVHVLEAPSYLAILAVVLRTGVWYASR